MSKLLCSAIWITSLNPIGRTGLDAVLAPPTIAAADGALVMAFGGAFVTGGFWAETPAPVANNATIKPDFRIEGRSMMKLAMFVKSNDWGFSPRTTCIRCVSLHPYSSDHACF